MHVEAIWRYPVKSMQGERLTEAELETDGLRHDRAWGIRSERTGHILTARRKPDLLMAASRVDGAVPEITLPDGTILSGTGPATDAALTEWLREPVRLVSSANQPAGVGEFFEDATDDTSAAIQWTMPQGRFVDAMPVLVLTRASLRSAAAAYPGGDWDPRRFRANVLVGGGDDEWVEDAWLHRSVAVGDTTVIPRGGCERCTMVTRPQPGLPKDVDIFRTILRAHNKTFGVWSQVGAPGTIRIDDPVAVTPDYDESAL